MKKPFNPVTSGKSPGEYFHRTRGEECENTHVLFSIYSPYRWSLLSLFHNIVYTTSWSFFLQQLLLLPLNLIVLTLWRRSYLGTHEAGSTPAATGGCSISPRHCVLIPQRKRELLTFILFLFFFISRSFSPFFPQLRPKPLLVSLSNSRSGPVVHFILEPFGLLELDEASWNGNNVLWLCWWF